MSENGESPRCRGCGKGIDFIHADDCPTIGLKVVGGSSALFGDRVVRIEHTGLAPEGASRSSNADQAPFIGCVSCHEGVGSPHRPKCPRSVGDSPSLVLMSESTDVRRWPPIGPEKFMGGTQSQDGGIKDDELKLEYHLLPNRAIQEVVGVLMYGKEKYAENNWKLVPGFRIRYFNAAMRHLLDSLSQDFDPETGFHHYAHAVCCLLFSMSNDMEGTQFPYSTLRTAMEKGRRIREERNSKKTTR